MGNPNVELSLEETLYIINHICLIPRLPDENDTETSHDNALLDLVIVALGEFCQLAEANSGVGVNVAAVERAKSAISVLREVRDIGGGVDEEKLREVLEKMNTLSDFSIPLQITVQNAGVLISKRPCANVYGSTSSHVIFQAFELSPLNEAVMSATGRLKRTFPGVTLAIPSPSFLDKSLCAVVAQTLSKMSIQHAMGMQPKVRKSRNEVDEERDTTHPGLVTELFPSGLLRPLGAVVVEDADEIHKNTWDMVMSSGRFLPWRRSPLWMLVRVVLQLNFTLLGIGQEERPHLKGSGNRSYKLFMAYLLSQLLRASLKKGLDIPTDTIQSMIGKLERRLEKFGVCDNETGIAFVHETLMDANGQLHDRMQKVNKKVNKVFDFDRLKTLNFEKDVPLELPHLDDFVAEIYTREEASDSKNFAPPAVLQRNQPDKLPCSILSDASDYNGYNLSIFEKWIKLYLLAWTKCHYTASSTCETLRVLMVEYYSAAAPHYLNNPEALSRMLLTLYELWVACDKSAIHNTPLLEEYHPKIPLEPLQSLLLPLKEDMARLDRVEKYISQRVGRSTETISVIKSFGKSKSFPVRYFDQSPNLQQLKNDIEARAHGDRAKKVSELKELHAQYNRLSALYDECGHDIEQVWNSIEEEYQSVHIMSCKKCSYKSQMSNINIEIHEWPLPPHDLHAKTVIFELNIPEEFHAWRETTVFMLTQVIKYRYSTITELGCEGGDGFPPWNYNALESYFVFTKTSRAKNNRTIGLLSPTKPHMNTHRFRIHISTANEANVCLNNGLCYRYYDAERKCRVKKLCSTNEVLQECTYKLPKQSTAAYEGFLARSFDSHGEPKRTPNCVMSTQWRCPEHFTLAEHRSLAAMPSGTNIQWGNVLVELASPHVDFKKVEVLMFILVVIYQTGPRGEDGGAVERMGHWITTEDEGRFCHEILERTSEAEGRIKENWESLHALNAFVSITTRILSLSQHLPQVVDQAFDVLASLRKTAFNWLVSLRDKCDTTDDEEQRSVFLPKMVDIALVCCCTFDVNPQHMKMLLSDKEAASILVQCEISIQECSPRNLGSVTKNDDGGMQKIMRQRWHRIAHQAYPLLRDQISAVDASTFTCLDDAITKSWSQYRRDPVQNWRPCSDTADYWLVTNTESKSNERMRTVHYNLLTGELLVNGLPLARLPSEYEKHETYSLLFGKFIFRVVPSSVVGMRLASKTKFHKNSLHFAVSGNDLLVRAEREIFASTDDGKDSGSEIESGDDNEQQKPCGGVGVFDFVPPRVFFNSIPTAFVKDYSHWYSHRDGTVEFHPFKGAWESSAETRLTLAKDASTGQWTLSRAGGERLVNPFSATGKEISTVFSALRPPLLIHIFLTPDLSLLQIRLPELRLTFTLTQGETSVRSRQFRGMVVDSQQDAGTLVGLVNKLVLKGSNDDDEVDRIVLIHTGTVMYSKEGDHTNVTISIAPAPEETTVYPYRLDKRLGRVVNDSGQYSKLFLAYLHALTTFCLPDKLTSTTGTEQALRILKSAAVWSFDYLGDDHVDILSRIQYLTPKRSYYPNHRKVMQKTSWIDSLGFLAQHGDFYNIIERLFVKNQHNAVFYEHDGAKMPSLKKTDKMLLMREMARMSAFYISEFGADGFAGNDMGYDARDRGLGTMRAQRALKAGLLMFERNAHLALEPEYGLDRQIWAKLACAEKSVQGPNKTLFQNALHYDSKWLEAKQQPEHLRELWCLIHKNLNVNSIGTSAFDKYRLMMWLSSMAFAEDVDMKILHVVAAMCTISEFGATNTFPPSRDHFSLDHGCDVSYDWIKNLIFSQTKAMKDCPEASIPRAQFESGSTYANRKQGIWTQNRDVAVNNFTNDLCKQKLGDSLVEPSSISTLQTYIHVQPVMSSARARFKSWHNNLLFQNYLEEMVNVLKRQRVRELEIPNASNALVRYESTLSEERHRAITALDLFSKAIAPSLSPQETKVDFVLRSPVAKRRPVRRLGALISNLKSRAKTTHESSYVEDLQESLDALQELPQEIQVELNDSTLHELLQRNLSESQKAVESLYGGIIAALQSAGGDKSRAFLLKLDHSPRLCPIFLLQQLAQDRWPHLPSDWRQALVDYGVALTRLQRAERLVRAARSTNKNDFTKELQNKGHTNWEPIDNPEALLLEVENGIMIRDTQEQIARNMRSPPDQRNAVMQLNMGEGKSSVIVPLVAVSLAQGDTLVRVVVGKPQRQQMFSMLVSKFGGLLGRPIYHMPFSRALKLGLEGAAFIRTMCEECIKMGGVMLVQPEHLLSFKLMGLECLITGKEAVGQSLLQTQRFFESKSRDIVDESDENFSIKFELIYTMGMQQPMEFSPERWIIIQELLTLVRQYVPQVKREMPLDVEIHNGCEGSFPRTRLIRKGAEDRLIELLAHKIYENGFSRFPIVRQGAALRRAVKTYISKRELSAQEIAAVEESDFWLDTTKSQLLLLRGLLAGGVIGFALRNKRWRVNYGLDSSRKPPTELAVPFRAKDSPTPRSEFSHPDVTITLTCLSYYYGGLNDVDLFRSFESIILSDQADAEYALWINDVPDLPTAFRQLQGINLRDVSQCKNQVFIHLRHSKGVIDYFLSHIVFPKLKQFPHKLSASGWDIGAEKTLPTTGFSGTIDSREVLPLDVKYCPLREQKHTNALVLEYLLQPENEVVMLPPKRPEVKEGSSSDATSSTTTTPTATPSDAETILSTVVAMYPPVRVLLDVGAQIIELTNKAVAIRWLGLITEKDEATAPQAAIFFDDYERMQVVDRKGRVESFDISPFAEQLDQCVVYLDESHTRGTDLRLPEDYRAAVTLGENLTKDRLVQACMRMRKLGKGQSVVFFVPEEIKTKIMEREGAVVKSEEVSESDSMTNAMALSIRLKKEVRQDDNEIKKEEDDAQVTPQKSTITVAQVLSWAISETHDDLFRSMPLWAAQGKRYETQRTLWSEVRTDDTFDMTTSHAEKFLEIEAQPLKERYKPRPANDTSDSLAPQDIQDDRLKEIATRCQRVGSSSRDPTSLQEEQERELSPEKEAERQIERPPQAKPAKHYLHPHIEAFVKTGVLEPSSPACMPAFMTLLKTNAARYLDPAQFPSDLLATRDFASTVMSVSGSARADNALDAFQRPVQWILTSRVSDDKMPALIISPYEADYLLPKIRLHKKTTLHMYSPRSNSEIRSLERLDLYAIPALPPLWTGLPASVTRQLNLFAGQLYFSSTPEYHAVCRMLGLSSSAAAEGVVVAADGFILGQRSGCTFAQSPVKFLKVFLSQARRDEQSIEKTNVGRMLDGDLLGEGDFEGSNLVQ